MEKVIAVDFDGTLCENKYPEIGEPIRKVIDALKREKENGARVILWTCRVGEYLEKAISWCHENGIDFDAVNDSLPEWKEMFGNNTRKIGATEYWDDRAYNPKSGNKSKVGSLCSCRAYLRKEYDGVFIQRIDAKHSETGEDAYIIHDAEERNALVEGKPYEYKESPCEGAYDVEKTYYTRVEKTFDGVVVGTKEIVTEGYLGVDTDYGYDGREVKRFFKEPKTKVMCAIVYYGNNKKRLVPLEDLEVNIFE